MSNATTASRGIALSPAAEETAWRVSVALAGAALMLPLLLVDVPPILDYPNHLARMWIIALAAQDSVMSGIAQANWAILPNLGTDLLLPPLIRVLPVHVAGRLMLAALLLLLFAGSLTYSRAVLGYRSPWALASALVACNAAFLLGFMNFCLGLGLALLFAAHWLRNREARPWVTLAVAVPGAVILFVSHMMGLFFFLLLISSHEATRVLTVGDWAWRTLARRVAFIVPLLVGPAMLYALSPLSTFDDPPGWSEAGDKALRLLFPLFGYEPWLDLATAAGVIALLVGLAASRRLRVPPATALAGTVLLVLYLAAPFTAKGVSYFDIRFIVMLWILLFAGLAPVRLPARLGGALALALAILFVARIGTVASVWHAYGAELAQLRWAMAPIRPGDRVLSAGAFVEDAPAYFEDGPRSRRMPDGTVTNGHRGAMSLIERRAFWPFLFANATQQPVRYLPPYAAVAEQSARMPSPRMLSTMRLTEDDRGWFPLWDRWWHVYDWVLVQDPGGVPDLTRVGGGHLELVRANGAAALYRVRTQRITAMGE